MFPLRVIIAAVDFSESSRAALIAAARLATQAGASLHVLHAEEPLLHAAAGQQGIDLSQEVLEELRAFVAGSPPAESVRPEVHVVAGPAAAVICDVALQQHADVIVVGSHGMSGATRLIFGSTTERVLRGAARSVLVTPDEWVPPQPDSPDLRGTGPIVAAVDFSSASTQAAAAAQELARMLDTSLELLHVIAEPRVLARWRGYADAAVAEGMETERGHLAAVVERLAPDVGIRLRVETGPVPDTLVDAAARTGRRNPILVLGRRAALDDTRILGPTVNRVLTLTRSLVLVHTRPTNS